MSQTPLLIGIGDLHGHLTALDSLLDSLNGKERIFTDAANLKLRNGVEIVFTGDYIDRGKNTIGVVEKLMDLAKANPTHVHELFGNHELIALADLPLARDLSESENAHFEYYGGIHGINGGSAFVREFGEKPQEAFKAYVERMSRTGDIGAWLRALKPLQVSAFEDKRVLFVHGGIPHNIRDAMDLVTYLSDFISHMRIGSFKHDEALEKYLFADVVGNHSIFWDRNMPALARQRGNGGEGMIKDITERLGVDFIVIGHTPERSGRIGNYFNRIFNADIGMSPVYGENEPGAVLFKPDGVFAFYARKGEERLV